MAILELVWRPGFQGRIDRFLERVATRLEETESRVGEIEQGMFSERFVAALTTAMAAAGRSSGDAKLEYLANAVTRTAVTSPEDLDADLLSVLLRLVDELTATHLHVLTLYADPELEARRRGIELKLEPVDGRYFIRTVVDQLDSSLARDELLLSSVLGDLEARNLFTAWGTNEPTSSFAAPAEVPTLVSDLGRTLVYFVSPPG